MWDFEHEHFLNTSFGESACSLSWLPDNAHSVAVGTSMGWAKVYDTRASSQQGAACSIMAHPAPRPRRIRGIRPDPFRQHLFATYSDFPGDVVKVWDLRKVSNPTSKAVVPPSYIIVPPGSSFGGSNSSNNTTGNSAFYSSTGAGASSSSSPRGALEAEAVADVAWSTSRPGVLALATAAQRSVHFYSTAAAVVPSGAASSSGGPGAAANSVAACTQTPLYSVRVPDPVQVNGLAWQQQYLEHGRSAHADSLGASAGGTGIAASALDNSPNSPLQADRKSVVTSMGITSGAAGASSSTSSTALSSWEGFKAEEELRNIPHASLLAAGGVMHTVPSRGGNNSNAQSHPRLLAAISSVGSIVTLAGAGTNIAPSAGCGAGGFVEVSAFDRLPQLAISTAGGLLGVTTNRGRSVALSKTNINQLPVSTGAETSGSSDATPNITYMTADVCNIMRRRCLAGYSADAYTNIDVLAEELDKVYSTSTATTSSTSSTELATAAVAAMEGMAVASAKAVYRTWVWMDRFESTINEPGLSVANCGVLDVLQSLRSGGGSGGGGGGGGGTAAVAGTSGSHRMMMQRSGKQQQGSNNSTTTTLSSVSNLHPTLGATVHSSESRDLCKRLCGWIKMFGLGATVSNGNNQSSASLNSDSSASTAVPPPPPPAVMRETSKGGKIAADDAISPKSTTGAGAGAGYWDTSAEDDLLEVVVDECFLESFERAAAIALWHGRLDLAVSVLRRAIAQMESLQQQQHAPLDQSQQRVMWDAPFAPGYLQTISLVAMCFAGYNFTAKQQQQQPSASGGAAAGGTSSGGGSRADFATKPASPTRQKSFQLQQSSSSQAQHQYSAPASASATWASMCRHVVAQLQQQSGGHVATGYLAAACCFLLANLGEPETTAAATASTGSGSNSNNTTNNDNRNALGMYGSIVDDERLTLEDRVAFACTFLPDAEAVQWLERARDGCAQRGCIEGVLITGISTKQGLAVLQRYIDIYDDVQTVALLVSRVIDSQHHHQTAAGGGGAAADNASTTAGAMPPSREWVWLHEYRNLLNRWEMFVERAYLDVELGKRYRRKAAMLLASSSGGSNTPVASALRGGGGGGPGLAGAKRGVPPPGGGKGQPPQQGQAGQTGQQQQQNKSKAGRVLYRLPVHSDYPHFYLRCGFCGAALPVDGMQNIRPEHLRLQGNVLNCCAACNKQLPNCYVCQLYMVSNLFPLNANGLCQVFPIYLLVTGHG